uniref:Uncharacterized protein n=1 Tax=Vespula pensylvanica TaxID=30213 RepID=A0A834UD89_VESPE|nr:hypothetical protein H0235_005199 [Vespula pensylvanica]
MGKQSMRSNAGRILNNNLEGRVDRSGKVTTRNIDGNLMQHGNALYGSTSSSLAANTVSPFIKIPKLVGVLRRARILINDREYSRSV